MCVLAAVMGAIDQDYRVVIVADAICSGADSTHHAMLEINKGRFRMQVEADITADFWRRSPTDCCKRAPDVTDTDCRSRHVSGFPGCPLSLGSRQAIKPLTASACQTTQRLLPPNAI